MINPTYRRNLPHIQPPEGTFFITYRLFGSIPKAVIERLKMEHAIALQAIDRELSKTYPESPDSGRITPESGDSGYGTDLEQQRQSILKKKNAIAGKLYFKKFDDVLDDPTLNEPHWLRNQGAAAFELNNIQFYAKKYFDLHTACIMSNHVHILLTMKAGAPILWKVLRDMKKYSSRQVKKMLELEGQFWEHESYDHLVRDGEFERIFFYILNNPVKAKVVDDWRDYPFTYASPALMQDYGL